MQITKYEIKANIENGLKIAHVSDLHDKPFGRLVEALKRIRPDVIAITGDLMDRLEEARNGLSFLREASGIAPTFYSLGNHERIEDGDVLEIAKTGTVLLDDAAVEFGGIHIGGLTSGRRGRRRNKGGGDWCEDGGGDWCEDGGRGRCGVGGREWDMRRLRKRWEEAPKPNLEWLDAFAALEGFKLLLCHHPEYYPQYIRERDIDLALSGHAHGGQWRILGRGILAPGQGFLPKYTSGIHENRLVVSRGLANNTIVPRLFNPTELVVIRLVPKDAFRLQESARLDG